MTTRSATLGILLLLAGAMTGPTQTPRAQGLALPDPVLEAIWTEAMENSSFEPMAHVLLDSIGPRLTGSPHIERAQE